MSEALQKKRVEKRHGEEEEGLVQHLMELHKYFEPVQEGEKDAYDLEITEHMTPDDVAEKVIGLIKSLDAFKVLKVAKNDQKITKLCSLF